MENSLFPAIESQGIASAANVKLFHIGNSIVIKPPFDELWLEQEKPLLFQHGISLKRAWKMGLKCLNKFLILLRGSDFAADPLHLNVAGAKRRMRIFH